MATEAGERGLDDFGDVRGRRFEAKFGEGQGQVRVHRPHGDRETEGLALHAGEGIGERAGQALLEELGADGGVVGVAVGGEVLGGAAGTDHAREAGHEGAVQEEVAADGLAVTASHVDRLENGIGRGEDALNILVEDFLDRV